MMEGEDDDDDNNDFKSAYKSTLNSSWNPSQLKLDKNMAWKPNLLHNHNEENKSLNVNYASLKSSILIIITNCTSSNLTYLNVNA